MVSTDVENHLRAHFECEQKTLQRLFQLEKEFREYNEQMLQELRLQNEWACRLSTLCQRYNLIQSTGPCCKYPEIYPIPTEMVILHEMADKIKCIKNSNYQLNNSLKELRKSCIVFEELYKNLDMTVESPLIIGDTFHKPIAYFIELVSDIFKFFHAWLLKLRVSASLLEPTQLDIVNKHKLLTEPSEDFQEYLNVGLTYCKCLRRKGAC